MDFRLFSLLGRGWRRVWKKKLQQSRATKNCPRIPHTLLFSAVTKKPTANGFVTRVQHHTRSAYGSKIRADCSCLSQYSLMSAYKTMQFRRLCLYYIWTNSVGVCSLSPIVLQAALNFYTLFVSYYKRQTMYMYPYAVCSPYSMGKDT